MSLGISKKLSKDYDIIEKIGEGSFSEVLKIENKQTRVKYAGKRLKRIFNNKEEVRNCPEVEILEKLDNHPNVMGLIDITFDKFPCFITLVFNLMDMTMLEYIKQRKRGIPESKVRSIFFQIISGVQHLHCNGIFHRDIKPENILIKLSAGYGNVREIESVQIADMGSACEKSFNVPHTPYVSTRWYRAPECLLTSGYYNHKMDIWSLGCVFYELLTLQPLFPGDNKLDQLYKIHEILGTPNKSILARFKHINASFSFPLIKPIGLHNLLSMLSENGLDVLNKTLAYHPALRIDIKRLFQHNYFINLRLIRRRCSELSIPSALNSACHEDLPSYDKSTKKLRRPKQTLSSHTTISFCNFTNSTEKSKLKLYEKSKKSSFK